MTNSTQWPPYAIDGLRRSLDALAEGVGERRDGRTDDEQIWLTRFFVVRIAGYLEQVVHETVRGYVIAKSGGLVRTFALSWLEKSRNPSPDNILILIGRLDQNLAEGLRSLLEDDDNHLTRELSLLLDRRHKIAHGLNEGMNAGKALTLRVSIERIASWFIKELDPTPAPRSSKQ